MARESRFDADTLRRMIKESNDANEICTAMGIKKTTLNAYLLKLMQLDKEFYEIAGMTSRITTPKVTKFGFKISMLKMVNYGFMVGDDVTITKQDDGAILIKKK